MFLDITNNKTKQKRNRKSNRRTISTPLPTQLQGSSLLESDESKGDSSSAKSSNIKGRSVFTQVSLENSI